MVFSKDEVLKDWPWTPEHLEDKFWWPWPWPWTVLGLALASKILSTNASLVFRYCIKSVPSGRAYSVIDALTPVDCVIC